MATRGRSRASLSAPDSYKFVYKKGQIIAQPPDQKGDEVKLFAVVEEMKTNDERGRVKVVQLEKLRQQKDQSVFQEAKEQLLAVQEFKSVEPLDQKKSHKKGAKQQFAFKNEVLEDLAKQVQQTKKETKKGAKQETSTEGKRKRTKHESDDDDEEDEYVEPKAAKKGPVKRAPKAKAAAKPPSDEDEEEEEEEVIPASKPKRVSKGSTQRTGSAQKEKKSSPKKSSAEKAGSQKRVKLPPVEQDKEDNQVGHSTRGRSRVQINYEESSHQYTQTEPSELEELSKSVESNKPTKGGKKPRASRAKAKPKKFVRGKFNPNIEEEVTFNKQLEDPTSEMLQLQAVKLNNKELIRAAYTGNNKLFENILKSKNKFSSFFQRWGPERDFNAIELLFINGNKQLLQKFLQALSRKDKLKLASEPPCSLKEINTGYNDKFAYGVKTRKVALARGGREGNNALVYDLANNEEWAPYMVDKLLETPTFPQMFSQLQTSVPSHVFQSLQSRVAVAVRAGNYQVAGHLIQQMYKKGGMYGFNQTHYEVLTLTDHTKLTPIKRPSAIKKNIGQMIITPIHCAAINPNEEILKALLDLSQEQSIMDELMRKPVHYAAVCVGPGPLKLLLTRGIDPREGDREKLTPLMLASKYGRVHNIHVLLKEGELTAHDIQLKSKEGNASIHYAAQGGHLQCLEALIEAGANINLTGKGKMTPLILASAHGHLDCVKFLLEKGAKPLLRDKMRRSALIMAVRNGNVEIASILLMKGAEFNGSDSSKNSAVHYAAAYGWTECIDLLIRAGADQNVKNSWNLTPLSVALQKNLFGVVKALLNYSTTDVNCKDDEGRTLVSSSLSKFTADSFEYIKFLILDKNADVTIPDLKLRTPLHYAAQLHPSNASQFYPDWHQKHPDEKKEIIESYKGLIFQLIDILISKGADINQPAEDGQTPFLTALVEGNYEIADKFMEIGEPNTKLSNPQDENIVHVMCKGRVFMSEKGQELFKKIFSLLSDKAAILNQVDANGYTPLQHLVLQYSQNIKQSFSTILGELEQEAFLTKLHNKDYDTQQFAGRPKAKKAARQTRKQKKAKRQVEEEDEEEEIPQESQHESLVDEDQEMEHDGEQIDQGSQAQSQLIGNFSSDDEDEEEQAQVQKQMPSKAPRKQLAAMPVKTALPSTGFQFNPSQSGFQFNPSQGPALSPGFQFGGGKSVAAKTLAFPFPFGTQPQTAPLAPVVDTFQAHYRSQTFYINNKPIIIYLNYQEHQELIKQAEIKYKKLEQSIIDIIGILLAEGADPHASVQRLKNFRKGFTNPQKMVEEKRDTHKAHQEEEEEEEEDEDEEDEEEEEEEEDGLRGGARTKMTARRAGPFGGFNDPFGQTNNSEGAGNKFYNQHGKMNVAHFIFRYHPFKSSASQILEMLKIDINQRDFLGRTPFLLFCEVANDQAHCDANTYIYQNHIEFFHYCLDTLHVNILQADFEKNTPTSILANNTRFNFAGQLIKLGATVNVLNKKNEVPLIKFVQSQNINHVNQLLTLGADPNFPDKHKRTALHHAVNCSNSSADASFEMEQALIKHGARADLVDRNNRTPLFYSFVKLGNSQDKSEIDPFETVSSLAALPDCDVTVVDKFKRTPLHYAAQRGAVISGRYLIKLKCQVDTFDADNNTPLGLAFINGHSNFATMLIDNKANFFNQAHIIDQTKAQKEAQKKQVPFEYKPVVHEDGYEESEPESHGIHSDDEESSPVPVQQQRNTGFGFGFNTGGMFGNHFGHHTQPQQNSVLNPGSYSFFMLAIKHGWQGVAYLLITDGFDLQQAIEDAMNANQFKLVKTLLSKVKDNQLIKKINSDGQNLFHTLAQKGSKANRQEAEQLIQEMFNRGIDHQVVDNKGRTALHYACIHNFELMYQSLLNVGSDINLEDHNGQTPFTLGLIEHFDEFASKKVLYYLIGHKLDLNKKFTVNKKSTSLLLYFVSQKNVIDEQLYDQLLNNGADPDVKDEEGRGVLAHSIIINSINLVNFFLERINKQHHEKDINGVSPVHLVVQPLSFGSYENAAMLKVVVQAGYDVNAKDGQGRTPLDYANEQDSGVMAKQLATYNAQASGNRRLQRQPTSIVAQADWPKEEIDFEADSQKYLHQKEEEETQRLLTLKKEELPEDLSTQVDKHCHQQGGHLSVVVDEQLGPYSLMMTKVDIKNGHYSENVFYRMQVIHEKNRNVYILFTRWGRVGTPGQFQMTPFENLEECVKEFNKIFSQKGGNDWRAIRSGTAEFEKKKGKYQLMNVGKHQNYKQFLEPFNFGDNSPYPPSTLDKPIRSVIQQFTQVKLYFKAIEQLRLDTDFMPLERLSKAQLLKAKSYLVELAELIHELEDQRKKPYNEIDMDELIRIQDDISEKSSRFFELIPHQDYKTEPIPPINNSQILNQKLNVIETLLQFEVTSKILLGAHLHKFVVNPLNYCFDALNIRLMTLPHDHPEYQLITTFIQRSHASTKNFVKNIFAIERRGEAERFETWKKFGNRRLLWHGSKVSNFMGILAQGLKVAPPWAMGTGSMFGKGIYFADTFEKSWAYTADWSLQMNFYNGVYYQSHGHQEHQDKKDISRYRYMMLCEVALGKSQKLYQAQEVENLPSKFQSVHGMGQSGPNPDQTIILQNGCQVPVGNIVTYENKNPNKGHFSLQHNEFIVYDETQVRIRYLLQLDPTCSEEADDY